MSKRKASEPEVREVHSKSSKKSRTTMNMGMCVRAFSILSSAMLHIERMEKAGWLAGWLMPDLVGWPFGRQAVFHLQDPTKLSCHRNTQRRASRPRTLNPLSLLALDHPYYQFTPFIPHYLLLLPDGFYSRSPPRQTQILSRTPKANATSTMPAPSAAQQKAYVSEVVQVTNADSKTAAKLLAKSNWNTSVAINAYVDTLLPGG